MLDTNVIVDVLQRRAPCFEDSQKSFYAIAIANNDYEDAVMIESAVRSGIDCIVTRNPEHFKPSSIPVYSPSEFAQKLNEPSA